MSFHGHHDAATPPAISVSTASRTESLQAPIPLTQRWLDLKTLSYSGRYRNTVNVDGRRLFEFGQEKYLAAGRIKDNVGYFSHI